MARLVCIGGPNDGEWIEVHDHDVTIIVPDRSKFPLVTFQTIKPSMEDFMIHYTTYQRDGIHVQGGSVQYLRPAGNDPLQTIRRLVSGYRATTQTD